MALNTFTSAIVRGLYAAKRFIAEQVNSLFLLVIAGVSIPAVLGWKALEAALEFLSGEKILFKAYLKTLKSNFPLFIADDVNGMSQQPYWENEIAAIEMQARSADPDRYDLSPMFRLELRLVSGCPEAVLRSRYWAIIDRFERVTNVKAIEKHKLFASTQTQPMSLAEMRADVGSLLISIHNNYTFEIERERSIKRLKIFLLCLTGTISALLVLFSLGRVPLLSQLGSPYTDGYWRSGMAAVFLCGVLGAFISIMQRMQTAVSKDALETDAVQDLSGLTFGYVGLCVALISGGVFAELMYLLMKAALYAGLVGDSVPVFPAFGACTGMDGEVCKQVPEGLNRMASALGLVNSQELSKMFVWAFLAGFSERLVPDVLDRLTSAANAKKAS